MERVKAICRILLVALAAGAPMKIVMVNIDQFQHLFVARPIRQ